MPDRNLLKEAKEIFGQAEHLHEWLSYQTSEDRCKGCNGIRVSEGEWERRRAVWRKFYSEEVTETPAYITFQSLRPYMKYIGQEMPEEEKKEMQGILKGMDDHYKENDYLKKPSFPDPERFNYNII